MTTVVRESKETQIRITLTAGTGTSEINTGEPFLDHMLVALARYSGIDMRIEATGDLKHHLIEDVAITLGALLERDTPPSCARYGDATVVMDEALVQVALDAGGRAHYEGPLPSNLYDHFFRSFALNAGWTVHVRVIRGEDRHHIVEAAFKALGLAVRTAMADDGGSVFSTKGAVDMRWNDGGDGAQLDETAELGPSSDDVEAGADTRSARETGRVSAAESEGDRAG
jgi:imidazoleglycerol-phosphate dehydratase